VTVKPFTLLQMIYFTNKCLFKHSIIQRILKKSFHTNIK